MVLNISILGFNLTKISGWKNPEFKGKIEISTSINISSIDKKEFPLLNDEVLKVVFSFKIIYKELGEISLEGELLLRTDKKIFKDVLKEWKEKKVNTEFQTLVLNLIIQRCSIRAIELEEELNLPIHINLPTLKLEKKEN